MIRIRLATSIGIAWRIPSESGGEISGIGTLLTSVPIWTLDEKLAQLADGLHIKYKNL
jgi:hypothetical protein